MANMKNWALGCAPHSQKFGNILFGLRIVTATPTWMINCFLEVNNHQDGIPW
jgi:hypothetical protein